MEENKMNAQPIDSKIPEGPIAEKWTNYKAHQKLVNPANKRKLDIIVVGTGLAGASAAATLGEMGFNVLNFCIQDSPRRAHSIAAQGGINAAKNYQNDGDSVYRLFYDFQMSRFPFRIRISIPQTAGKAKRSSAKNSFHIPPIQMKRGYTVILYRSLG